MNNYHRILSNSSDVVARRLLGALLIRTLENGKQVIARIVETESYHSKDPASHSYRGETARTKVMFGPPGFAYVYFIYGKYHCLNIVCGPAGEGSAVLIRAAEAIGESSLDLRGPGKLCRALNIGLNFNGHNLLLAPLQLVFQPEIDAVDIIVGPRIGISKAKDVHGRFYIRDNLHVSRL